ncbi:DUF2513 domain-containing protein [Variovorax sp. N23]|uniref:DUF2513 domain-containing protein n=1 Tax=Variovorax sp. N23 TaxID=2980555 RepID=UPI0021C769B0|nr:DUF2513 domain-containing protein [Variovorax sp. N23]MCU4120943.1 DUF2513 domain-containing protein [Variovorax sp. N23]
MKRDWDLIRKLLIDIEEGNDFLADDPVAPQWLDQSERVFAEQMAAYKKEQERLFGHLELLLENGYTDGYQVLRGADGYFSYGVSAPRLTMAGHDLLDTMRSSKVWGWVKATASTKGVELSFDAVKTLSAMALKAVLGG